MDATSAPQGAAAGEDSAPGDLSPGGPAPFGLALPGYLGLCLVLGGASGDGPILNGVVQLAGVALLWRASGHAAAPDLAGTAVLRALRYLLLALAAWIVLQLVPLPAGLWTALEPRGTIAAQMALLGNVPGWRPLAIEWERTLVSMTGFIPPLAVAAMAVRAERAALGRAVAVLAAVAVAALLLGAAQVIAGSQHDLTFYRHTVAGAPAGFFANYNHAATLLCAAAALAIPGAVPQRRPGDQPGFAWLGWLALAALFVAGALLNRSLAGLGLGLAVAAYCALVLVNRKLTGIGRRVAAGAALLATAAAGLAIWFAPRSLADQFLVENASVQSRGYLWAQTWQAVGDSFPAGVGLGNFRWVFPRYEDLQVTLANYANHAHNDWLEFLLEGGLFALVLLALLGWLIAAAARAALAGAPAGEPVRRLAPFVVLAILMAHSVVDYPLRTAALAAVGALALVMAMRGYALGERRTD